jgi:hypothetical protein
LRAGAGKTAAPRLRRGDSKMKVAGRIALLTAGMSLVGTADAGHESPVYPSFYPQQIRIEPIDPANAGDALARGRIQAYVGAVSGLPANADKSVKFVESLGSYLVVRVNAGTPRAADASGRCALAARVVAALSGQTDGFHYHPYPVNPLHADYLHHFDLAAAAGNRIGNASPTGSEAIRVRALGPLAERLAGARFAPATAAWDASVEQIDLDRLVAATRFASNGWMGPPWLKEGWFHAYLLLGRALDEAPRQRADALVARLQRGEFANGEEGINLERDLLRLLTADCRTVVAGYATRRWHHNDDYSLGVENIAYDSHSGFHSAIFIRTVKLRDFPWNGWLTLGVPGTPAAAWNPLGGFTDATGQLIWLTLGDPAMFPEPYGAGWSVNRIGSVKRGSAR